MAESEGPKQKQRASKAITTPAYCGTLQKQFASLRWSSGARGDQLADDQESGDRPLFQRAAARSAPDTVISQPRAGTDPLGGRDFCSVPTHTVAPLRVLRPALPLAIQRRILIGAGEDQRELGEGEAVLLTSQPFSGMVGGEGEALDRPRSEYETSRYVIYRNQELARLILDRMRSSSWTYTFPTIDRLRISVARRVKRGQGVRPREIGRPASLRWLDENGIAYTPVPAGRTQFANAIEVDFAQVVPGIDMWYDVTGSRATHNVVPRLAMALTILMRHLAGLGVTILHQTGVSGGTHTRFGYAIDIRGFTFSDGTRILLPPAWNDETTTVPGGETASTFMHNIGQWMADNVFGQVLGPGYPRHANHFHCQVPFGARMRGLVTSPQ